MELGELVRDESELIVFKPTDFYELLKIVYGWYLFNHRCSPELLLIKDDIIEESIFCEDSLECRVKQYFYTWGIEYDKSIKELKKDNEELTTKEFEDKWLPKMGPSFAND